MNEEEVVEVVYGLESLKQAVLLIAFGAYVGFTIGLSTAWKDLADVQAHRATINGDVTINKRVGDPMTISNMNINANGAECAIKISEVKP